MRNIVKAQLAAAASLAVLGLAACREDEGRDVRAAIDPAPIGYGSPGMLLPMAEPARVSWYEPERGYEWAERAYGLQRAYYDAPPDYTFDYGPYDPWVWETADEGYMYAEPWGDDGYLYYYFEPEAAYPYFVRDAQYGYGFDTAGMLVALFDPYGNYLPVDQYAQAAPLAGRYYAHGHELRRASLSTARIPVQRTVWEARAPLIRGAGSAWIRAAETDADWKAWRGKGERRERVSFAPTAAEPRAAKTWDDRGPGKGASAREDRKEVRVRAREADRVKPRQQRDERHAAWGADHHGRPVSFEDRGRGDRGGGPAKADTRGGGPQDHGRGKPDDRGRGGSDHGQDDHQGQAHGGEAKSKDHAGHGGGQGGGGQGPGSQGDGGKGRGDGGGKGGGGKKD